MLGMLAGVSMVSRSRMNGACHTHGIRKMKHPASWRMHSNAAQGRVRTSAMCGADEHCRQCKHWSKIKSPIVLGIPHTTAQPRPDTADNCPVTASWPQMADEAFYGLAGDIVRAINPYTEADPVAVLLNILVAAGNVIGPSPQAPCTARSSFGTAERHPSGRHQQGPQRYRMEYPRYLLSQVDPPWAASRIKSGLSSGEGLLTVRPNLEVNPRLR